MSDNVEPTDLEEILGESTGEAKEPEAEPEPEIAEAAPEPENEPAAEASEEQPEKDSGPPQGYVPQAALQDERSKRQALEQRLAELEKQPEGKPVDFFDDPEKWSEELKGFVQQETAKASQAAENRFLALCEDRARKSYEDFDEAAQVFAQAAQQNPALVQEARNALDPAEYVYQAGSKLKLLNTAGSLDALLEKAKKDAIAEYQKSHKPNVPQSLTETPSPKDTAGQKWQGPTSLEDVIPTNF